MTCTRAPGSMTSSSRRGARSRPRPRASRSRPSSLRRARRPSPGLPTSAAVPVRSCGGRASGAGARPGAAPSSATPRRRGRRGRETTSASARRADDRGDAARRSRTARGRSPVVRISPTAKTTRRRSTSTHSSMWRRLPGLMSATGKPSPPRATVRSGARAGRRPRRRRTLGGATNVTPQSPRLGGRPRAGTGRGRRTPGGARAARWSRPSSTLDVASRSGDATTWSMPVRRSGVASARRRAPSWLAPDRRSRTPPTWTSSDGEAERSHGSAAAERSSSSSGREEGTAKSSASNGRRSSSASPIPMQLDRDAELAWRSPARCRPSRCRRAWSARCRRPRPPRRRAWPGAARSGRWSRRR